MININDTILILLVSAIIVGAVTHGWLHAFAVGFDLFIQDLVWDAPIGVTISSRAGLAARNGKPLGAKIVNKIMFNPNHCEEAIAWDIQRAQEALKILNGE